MVAAAIDNIALVVHHVIIFQQTFSDSKIIFFHFLLRTLDALCDHAVLYHITFLVTELVHETGNAFTAEHTHEIIFEAHIELRSTGITLAACTSAQLPVHAAALVALRANDGKTTGFFYTGAEFDIRT